MTRRLIGSLLLALPLAILVGCSSSSSPSKSTTTSAGPKGETPKDKKLAPVESVTAPPGK